MPPSNYPTGKDTFIQVSGAEYLNFPLPYGHAGVEDLQNNALSAIQNYVGVTAGYVNATAFGTITQALFSSGTVNPGHLHTFADIEGVLAVTAGGTGATSVTGAAASLLPPQAGNGGKFLETNGSTVSWQFINNNTTLASAVATITDDFVGGNSFPTTLVATSGIGECGWISNAGVPITGGGISAADSINHPGVLKWGGNNSNAIGIYLANVIGDLAAPSSNYLGIVNLSTTGGAFGFGIAESFLVATAPSNPYLMIYASGGVWSGAYSNGSVQSIAGTSIVTTGWSDLLIQVNSSGNSASFSINDTIIGTVPISASNVQTVAFFSNLAQQVVTSNPTYSVDLFSMFRQITR
jgi:hypothetical protein